VGVVKKGNETSVLLVSHKQIHFQGLSTCHLFFLHSVDFFRGISLFRRSLSDSLSPSSLRKNALVAI